MLIDTQNRIAYLDVKSHFAADSSVRVDLRTGETIAYDAFPAGRVIAASADWRRVALISDWIIARGTNKTELGVLDAATGEVVWQTKKYLVFGAAFDSTGDRLLVMHNPDKVTCLDAATGEPVGAFDGKVDIRKGELDAGSSIFWAPDPRAKARVAGYDFASDETVRVKVPVSEETAHVRMLPGGDWLVSTDANTVHRLTGGPAKPVEVWRWPAPDGVRVSSSSLERSGDDRYLCVDAPSTPSNSWGEEFVLDLAGGQLLRTIQSGQGRGRVGYDFLDSTVLLHTGRTLDLASGETSPAPVLPRAS